MRTGFVDTPSPRNFREASINGNFATPLFGGRLSTTQQIDYWRFHALNGLDFFDTNNVLLEDFTGDFTEHQTGVELGFNYDRPVAGWDVSLVALVNRRYYRNEDQSVDLDGAGALNFTLDQQTAHDSGETILRSALSRNFGAPHRVEFGIEGARNTLDAQLDLVQDTGGGPAPLIIPNANVTVEEDRWEAFASYTWRPNDQWSVETRVARETSILTFTGDSNQEVELAYIKPSIQVSRSFGGGNQLRVRYYRDVGQLDFGDFVSASSAVDQLINGGNPDLKPQTAWRGEIGGDLRWRGIALTWAYTHHWISDAQDLVPITVPNNNPPPATITFDAPGNIGDASAEQLVTNLTLPFGQFMPGAQLKLNTSYFATTVTDPVTGRDRAASGNSNFCYNGEFRQDLSARQLTWGLFFEKCVENQTYRLNETDTSEEGPYVDFYVETTAIPGVKMRAILANILDSPVRRQRLFFTGDRNGPLERYEERQREFNHAPWLILRVSGTF